MKLNKLSLAELSEQHEERKRKFEERRLEETQKIYIELAGIAEFMGVSIRSLFERCVKPGDKPLPVFYVNPENVSQQWRGRGSQPKWLRDWIAEGKSLDMVRF